MCQITEPSNPNILKRRRTLRWTFCLATVGLCLIFAVTYASGILSGQSQMTGDMAEVTDETYSTSLRGTTRRLPGETWDIDNVRLDGPMGGFVAGLAFALLILFLLCCCCCGGGRGCSLWDILACVCIYELCCDDGNIGGFQLF